MSQFPPALEYVLQWEDPRREYAIVPDVGGNAIAGINSHSWPTAFANISRLPQDKRAAAVANFYLTEFWNVMRLGGINSQDLANRVLDCGVNCGPYTATRMLQEAAGVPADGILGPVSLEAVNQADTAKLLAIYRKLRLEHYEEIVKLHPEDAKYRSAWEARARA